jgi:hypothetical protein
LLQNQVSAKRKNTYDEDDIEPPKATTNKSKQDNRTKQTEQESTVFKNRVYDDDESVMEDPDNVQNIKKLEEASFEASF